MLICYNSCDFKVMTFMTIGHNYCDLKVIALITLGKNNYATNQYNYDLKVINFMATDHKFYDHRSLLLCLTIEIVFHEQRIWNKEKIAFSQQ